MNLTCPACHLTLRADASAAGTNVRCPGCGKYLQIPGTPPERSSSTSPHSRSAPPPRRESFVPPAPPGRAALPPTNRDEGNSRPVGKVVLAAFLSLSLFTAVAYHAVRSTIGELQNDSIVDREEVPPPQIGSVPFSPPVQEAAPPPDPPRPAPVPIPVPVSPMTEPPVDLVQAVREGRVECSAQGAGLDSLRVRIKALGEPPSGIRISSGTLFVARDAGVQNMVIRRTLDVPYQGRVLNITLSAACANMNRQTPGERHDFTLDLSEGEEPQASLREVLALETFSSQSFRIQQFCVWTLTDDPTRDGYVGLGSFGFGSGPTTGELEAIRSLLRAAGIRPERHRAFQSSPSAPPSRPSPPAGPPASPMASPVPPVLVPERTWTDKQGRTLLAELLSVELDAGSGRYVGRFRRPDGEEFSLPIGRLSPEDVETVRRLIGAPEDASDQ